MWMSHYLSQQLSQRPGNGSRANMKWLLFVLCLCFKSFAQGRLLKSLVFQENGSSSRETYAVLENPPLAAQVYHLSFCIKIYLNLFKPSIAYVFESGPRIFNSTENSEGNEEFDLLLAITTNGPWVGIKNHNFVTKGKVLPLEWNHFCFAYDGDHNSAVMVQNGQVILNITNHASFDRQPLSPEFLENLILGQRQISLRDPILAFSGEIAEFNVWNRTLTLREQIQTTSININGPLHKATRHSKSDSRDGEGTHERKGKKRSRLLLDWNTQRWKYSQVQETFHDMTDNRGYTLVMFPERRTFSSAKLLCNVLNGRLAVPKNERENVELHRVSIGNFSICNRRHLEYIWLGITDGAVEGTWRMESQGQEMLTTSVDSEWNIPWEQSPQEPNGGSKENCGAMKRGLTWLDIQCSYRLCAVCNFSSTAVHGGQFVPSIPARLDPEEAPRDQVDHQVEDQGDIKWEVDLPNQWSGVGQGQDEEEDDDNDQLTPPAPSSPPRLMLRGLCEESSFDTHYTLVSDNLTDPYAYAFHNTSQDYPLGKRSWYFVNESCLHNRFQIRRLKLTTCEAESQFTCDDGTCISIMGRCDQKRDCDDFSDEFDCKLVSLNQFHYIKDYPPQERGGRRTEVTYHVEILSLDDIRELGMSLNVQFRLNLSWLDPRIIYHNLKDDPVMNSLTQGEKEKIWIPKIIFNNTDDENESILDAKASLSVIKRGNYTLSSIKEEGTDEKYIFSGAENPLVYSRHHNIQFQCNFDMTYYPFDVQMCYMIFRRIPHGRFALNPSRVRSLTYLGERELLQYFIDDWNILTESDSGFVIVIRMKRRYLYQLLTTYLPSLCLFFIIHATQYFKISYFHTRIMVSLTGMLVMTTLFLNTSSTLPKTSYFKMIDIWMVFGLLLPFLEVVLHTVTEYRRRDPRYRPAFEEIRPPSCTPIEINPIHPKCKNNGRMMGRHAPGNLDFGSKYPSSTCCRDMQNGSHEWMGGGLNTDESLILPLPPPSPTSCHSNLDDKSGEEAFGITVQSSPPNRQIARTCSLKSQERRRKTREGRGSKSSNIEMHGSRSQHQLEVDAVECTRHVGPTIKVEDTMEGAVERDQRCPLISPISGDNLQVKSSERHSPISDCKLRGQGQRLASPSPKKTASTPNSSRVSGLETNPSLEQGRAPEIPSNPQILSSQGQSFRCGQDLSSCCFHHHHHHDHQSSLPFRANEGADGNKQGQEQSSGAACSTGKETSAWLLKNNRYWKWIYSCCVRPELTTEQQTNKNQEQQQQPRLKHQFVHRPSGHCCCCQGSNLQVRTLNVEDCQYDENAQSGLLTPALPWDIADDPERPLSRSPDLVTADLSRTIVPLLIFLFNVVYWTVAFLHN